MPASFFIDVARRCVFSRAWGEVGDDDLVEHATCLREHSSFDPSFRQIIDYRDITRVKVTTQTVRGLASLNPFQLSARRAVIVRHALVHGLARMYQLSAGLSSDAMQIFEAPATAFEWLGLPHDERWPDTEPHWQRPGKG